MDKQAADPPSDSPAFYPDQYRSFASPLAAEVRRLVYGEDLGQQGWRTLDEQEAIVRVVSARAHCAALDVACGSGGPSLALVQRTGCRLVGLDGVEAAVCWARREAERVGLAGLTRFETHNCDLPLPFDDETFDVVMCIDAVLHLADRAAALTDWARVLREGGRLVFADAAVLTGPVSKGEIDIRASQGPFTLVPPTANERMVEAAGLVLVEREDKTDAAANLALRWLEVRAHFAEELAKEEGDEFFARRQRFLATTANLAATRRLSRFLYVAEKIATFGSVRGRPPRPANHY
jgi:SAM-dependent methyltransferase